MILLNLFLLDLTEDIGTQREYKSIADNRKNKHGCTGEKSLLRNISGARGELVVSMETGLPWGKYGLIDTFDKPDVGDNCQVRTRSKSDYELIIRPKDKGHEFFFLVIDYCPWFDVIGFIKGKDGKRDEWWKTPNDRPPAWFVPQKELKKWNSKWNGG